MNLTSVAGAIGNNTSSLINSSTTEVAAVATTAVPPSTALPLGVRITIIAYCYILPTICLVGIVGNVMNVITLASRRLRAVSYMYLRALAIADLLCMLFVLAFVSGEVLSQLGIALNRYHWYGFYQTHLMLSLINWALSAGVYIVLALSLERYISVVFPMHFRQWNSPQRAMRAIVVAFVVPAILYIPYAIARYSIGQKLSPEGHPVYSAIDSELSKTFGWKIYKWSREGLLRFLPIVALSILNLQIMLAFRKRQRMFARLKKRDQNKDSQLLYILGGIIVMFFVCNIPAAINLLFINETVKKRTDYQIFRALANLLEITNHAAQFYIFCVCSTDYRITFMRKFPLPCFQSYVISKSKFFSIVRKDTTIKDSSERPQQQLASHITDQSNEYDITNNSFAAPNSAKWYRADGGRRSHSSQKKNTTVTAEALSSTFDHRCPYSSNVDDLPSGDAQLASGEDETSEDSDTLLRKKRIIIETGSAEERREMRDYQI